MENDAKKPIRVRCNKCGAAIANDFAAKFFHAVWCEPMGTFDTLNKLADSLRNKAAGK